MVHNNRVLILAIVLLGAACLASAASSAQITMGDVSVAPGGEATTTLTLSDASPALADFDFSVLIADGSKATFTQVTYPSWAAFSSNPRVPNARVNVSAINGGSAPTTSIPLVTLKVQGITPGTTSIGVTVKELKNYNGVDIPVTFSGGSITVGGVPPTTVVPTTVVPTTVVPTTVIPTTTGTPTQTPTTVVPTTVVPTTVVPTTVVPTTVIPTTTGTPTQTPTTPVPTTVVPTTPTPPAGTGGIAVGSTPALANVYVDGNKVGTTTFVGQGIPVGLHNIQIWKEGYLTYSRVVTVVQGETVYLGNVLLEKGYSPQPTPTSSPTPTPTTPVPTTVTPTTVQPTTPVPTTITPTTIVPTTTRPPTTFVPTTIIPTRTPAPLPTGTGGISIGSVPVGAAIYVNEVWSGQTPSTVLNIKPGKYLVTLKLDGYQPFNREVIVRDNQITFMGRVWLSKIGKTGISAFIPFL